MPFLVELALQPLPLGRDALNDNEVAGTLVPASIPATQLNPAPVPTPTQPPTSTPPQQTVVGGTAVPTPADSVEEFRVTTANPDANFERASGGQMTLVGRHGECEQLDRLLEGVRAQRSSTIVMRGEPGVGKSTLLL